MSEGYIKLHRQILRSDIFASPKMLKIWLWCLCKANYKTRSVTCKKGRGETIVKLNPGQFIFGKREAGKELDIAETTILRIIKKLEILGNISIKSNHHYSIIGICNWDKYQQNSDVKQTGNVQPTKTGRDINERMLIFKKEIESFDKYNIDMLTSFYAYWSEPNRAKSKMRYEMEKTWDTSKRLLTWFNRSKK